MRKHRHGPNQTNLFEEVGMAKPSFITSHKELLFTGTGVHPVMGAASSVLVDANSIGVSDASELGRRS